MPDVTIAAPPRPLPPEVRALKRSLPEPSFLIAGTLCTLAVPSAVLAQPACPRGYPAFNFAEPHLDPKTCRSGTLAVTNGQVLTTTE